jgi:hypothetical protein
MLTLQLSLDFACCACNRPVGVTLKCEGDGLKALRPTAAVTLACPTCGALNQVEFSPYERKALRVSRDRLPQPCPN